MKNKLIISSLFIFLINFYTIGVENSIIPTIEKFEAIENLSIEKYSKSQFAEIQKALSQKEDRIRLMTYNMLFNLYDHDLDEENRWPQRCPRLSS
jgi:hypothetical protein